MMIARHGTASHVERLVKQFRKVKRIEALEQENQRHALRELNWFVDDDGSYVFRARLTPEQGERVARASKWPAMRMIEGESDRCCTGAKCSVVTLAAKCERQ